MSERSPSVYPSYKPESGLIPRKATLAPPILPTNRAPRRLPRSRTRVATPLSESASRLPIGAERGVHRCHDLRCSPEMGSGIESRFHRTVRLVGHRIDG